MSTIVLLGEHRLKKRAAELKNESIEDGSLVTLEFMIEFRAEMRNEFAKIHAHFDRIEAKVRRKSSKVKLVHSKE